MNSTSKKFASDSAAGTAKYGRSKFGGSTTTLLLGAAILGLIVAFAIALIFWLLTGAENATLYLVVYTLCLFPAATAAAWLCLVDRTSIAGAAKHPENSVESAWYDNAAQTTFHIILLALGALGVASVFTSLELSLSVFAIGSFLFIAVVFGFSYLLNQRRGA